jgi:hypothetical protein
MNSAEVLKRKKTAEALKKHFKDTFKAFEIVEHPDNLPGEVKGKAETSRMPDITYKNG